MKPIPGGSYSGEKTDNGMSLRLSPGGVDFINSNWKALIETFAPGQTIHVPVACSRFDVGLTGVLRWVLIADQGSAGCTSESCGRMDGDCDAQDAPADIPVRITDFRLVPQSPDVIEAAISLSIDTGKIYVDTEDRTQQKCLIYPSCVSWGLSKCPVKCSLTYNNALDAPPSHNELRATVKFAIDSQWDKLLSFSVSNLDGTKVCGSSGAPSGGPGCLEPKDVDIDGENACGGYCKAVDWNPVKSSILKMVSPMLQKSMQDMLKKQSCQECGPANACPSVAGATSSCDTGSKLCMQNGAGAGKCVPRFLGLEGRLQQGVMLQGFGAPPEAEMDLSIGLGSMVSVDQGVKMGTRTGAAAVGLADCVPLQAPPPAVSLSPPDFDAEADLSKGPYHLGLGISGSFLNLAAHHLHQSGALCLSMNHATTSMLNTGLFPFLPSLGRLAKRDGKDAPMMVIFRPAKPPAVKIGKGTFDPATKKPLQPLLLVTMPDFTVDFYAMFDERWARLFSLTADITLPLSLIFEGCDKVTPALGDLKQMVTNVRPSASEILAEDPKVLADIIPMVVGMAEPALAQGFPPFTLPQMGAFKLKLNEAKGLSNLPGTEEYQHIGLYGQLLTAGSACAVASPLTEARLKRAVVSDPLESRRRGEPLQWPVAILEVRSLGLRGSSEFSYRVDRGMWSPFLAASEQGELEVSHPVFLFQGEHTIQVRSRMAETPHGVSAPVEVGFRVDWQPPEVELRVHRAEGSLEVLARDLVSPPEALQYAYRVGQGPFSAFGPPRSIDLLSVERQGGVTVQVRDEAGNVGQAVHRVAMVEPRRRSELAGESELPAAGCSAAGGLSWLGGLAALLALRKRRR